MRKFSCLNIIIFVLVLIDRLSKFLILKKPSNGFFIIDQNFFKFGFKFYGNQNLAFSIPFPQILIYFFTIVIVLYLLYLLYKSYSANNYQYTFFYSLIICGALSNFFDRIYYGYVIDFINVYFGFFNFAIFNISDTMIVIGVLGLSFGELKKTDQKKLGSSL